MARNWNTKVIPELSQPFLKDPLSVSEPISCEWPGLSESQENIIREAMAEVELWQKFFALIGGGGFWGSRKVSAALGISREAAQAMIARAKGKRVRRYYPRRKKRAA